jgi:hypothetical protein
MTQVLDIWVTQLPMLGLAFCLVVLLRQQLRLSRLQRQLARPQEEGREFAELKTNVDAMLRCNRGVSDMLREHQRQIRQLQSRQEGLELQDSGLSRYRQAVTLIGKGADQEELISSCGLSRGEAELVAHIGQLQRRAS